MEKLLRPGKGDFLLESPLEVLHQESMEWLEEIEFWKDEVAFFYKLMITRKERKPPTKTLLSVQNQIIYFSAEKLDDLKLEIQTHEQFLSRIMKASKQDDGLYRRRHLVLSGKIAEFEKQFREMKKKVFSLVKRHPKARLFLSK